MQRGMTFTILVCKLNCFLLALVMRSSSLSFKLQVLSSTMIIREDADIGSLIIGDVHKKSRCVQLRVLDAIDLMKALRKIQLSLLYSGLGLEDPTDDIADDVPLIRTLVGEFTKPVQANEGDTPRGFVAEVQDALNSEGIECSQRLESTGPQELGESENPTQDTPVKAMSSPAPLSPDGLLCTMHSQSPCTPTSLKRGSDKGPWIHRSPALTMTIETGGVSVTRKLELAKVSSDVGANSHTSTHVAISKEVSCVSEVLEQRGKIKVSSTLMDGGQDDVISVTTHKVDGRYV